MTDICSAKTSRLGIQEKDDLCCHGATSALAVIGSLVRIAIVLSDHDSIVERL